MIYDTTTLGWQSRLAKDAGISPSTLTDILKGKSRPRESTAKKLEKVTEVEWMAWVFPKEHSNPYFLAKAYEDKDTL